MNAIAEDTQVVKRAMSTGSTPVAGRTLEEFVVVALEKQSPVRREATLLPTEHGDVLDIPVVVDDEDAELHDENQTATSPDIAVGSLPLRAFTYDSGQLRVSTELWRDGGQPAHRMFGRALASRISRTSNRHFTTGTGVSQPKGIVTASGLGETTAVSNALTYDELLNLLHSVPDEYQDAAAFMMNSDTLRVIRTLVDPSGNPAYQNGLLLNKRIVINAAMASIAAGAKPILYGDFSLYHIRDVGSVEVRHSEQRYAEFGQVGVAATLRADGNLVDVNAVKHLLMAT